MNRKAYNLDHLQKVSTYAKNNNVTVTYINNLIREDKIKLILIDNVRFIDYKLFPKLPSKAMHREKNVHYPKNL